MSRIYLIERNSGWDYDTYGEFVVIADTPKKARELTFREHDPDGTFPSWTRDVTTTLIGTSKTKTPRIVSESFNAG